MSQQERGQPAEQPKVQQTANDRAQQLQEDKQTVEVQQKIEQVEQPNNELTLEQKTSQIHSEVQRVQPQKLARVQPPAISNPIYFYKGHEKYNWEIEMLDGNSCLQKIQDNKLPELCQFAFQNQVEIAITTVTNIKGHLHYTLDVKDKKGQREISRRYSEFILLRAKLLQLWPGILFTTLPNKTLIGVSQTDLIRNRSLYITRFLRSLSRFQVIYYSTQSQNFLNNSQENNVEAYLQSITIPKSSEVFEKYKTAFPTQYQHSLKQDFLYRKDEVPASLQAYQTYFTKKKIDLSEYLNGIRRMAESKQKYFRAASKLNLSLLADYEDTIYRWIYGEPLPKSPPSIMERMSLKSLIGKENQSENKAENQEGQSQVRQRKLSKEIQKVPETKFGLFSSQAYKSRFEDTALQIENYNEPNWKLYNVFKFQLKEIDSVVGAIQQTKAVGREIQHLKRTIGINKEQVEALNNNKTTLKTFFMDGNKDEKKTKLSNENQALQESLQKSQDFYYLLMVLLEQQVKQYHQQRADFYKKSLSKALNEELGLSRKIMDFYVYEQQLLYKQIKQRISLMREDTEPLKQVEVEAKQ